MKTKFIYFFIVLFLTGLSLSAQVTTYPEIIQKDYEGEITIYFDATQGSKGMIGATECYAHTGVITSLSTSGTDWKHAPTWGTNTAKYKLDPDGDNKWKLTISSLKEYYELTDGEIVEKLAFVFRDRTGSKTGKTSSGGDIFVELAEPGLSIAMINPASENAMYKKGTTTTISVVTTIKIGRAHV